MKGINIHIKILDREYPLTVTPESEILLREAEKHIQLKLEEYRKTYVNSDKQDILAMAVLLYATEALRFEKSAKTADSPKFDEILKSIEHLLDTV